MIQGANVPGTAVHFPWSVAGFRTNSYCEFAVAAEKGGCSQKTAGKVESRRASERVAMKPGSELRNNSIASAKVTAMRARRLRRWNLNKEPPPESGSTSVMNSDGAAAIVVPLKSERQVTKGTKHTAAKATATTAAKAIWVRDSVPPGTVG